MIVYYPVQLVNAFASHLQVVKNPAQLCVCIVPVLSLYVFGAFQSTGNVPKFLHDASALVRHKLLTLVDDITPKIASPKIVSITRAVTRITTAATIIWRVIDMPLAAMF